MSQDLHQIREDKRRMIPRSWRGAYSGDRKISAANTTRGPRPAPQTLDPDVLRIAQEIKQSKYVVRKERESVVSDDEGNGDMLAAEIVSSLL